MPEKKKSNNKSNYKLNSVLRDYGLSDLHLPFQSYTKTDWVKMISEWDPSLFDLVLKYIEMSREDKDNEILNIYQDGSKLSLDIKKMQSRRTMVMILLLPDTSIPNLKAAVLSCKSKVVELKEA